MYCDASVISETILWRVKLVIALLERLSILVFQFLTVLTEVATGSFPVCLSNITDPGLHRTAVELVYARQETLTKLTKLPGIKLVL